MNEMMPRLAFDAYVTALGLSLRADQPDDLRNRSIPPLASVTNQAYQIALVDVMMVRYALWKGAQR